MGILYKSLLSTVVFYLALCSQTKFMDKRSMTMGKSTFQTWKAMSHTPVLAKEESRNFFANFTFRHDQ